MQVDMKIPKLTKIKNRADASDFAIKWQEWQSKTKLSWNEIICWHTYFFQLGTQFNLLNEFEENGIL